MQPFFSYIKSKDKKLSPTHSKIKVNKNDSTKNFFNSSNNQFETRDNLEKFRESIEEKMRITKTLL